MIRGCFFGQVPYLTGLQIQESLFQRLHAASEQGQSAHQHFLCIFEHNPPAYTVGLREGLYSAGEEQRIRALGAEFHRVKRGGLITFHGPGQLVAYPLFNLRTLPDGGSGERATGERMAVRQFVHLVEEAIIQMLREHFQLEGVGRTQDTGVWLDGERKIAALGIQVRHGITSHGLALNCETDLGWFNHIVPCGLPGKSVTSLSRELGRSISVKETIEPLCQYFQRIFRLPLHLENADDLLATTAEGKKKDDD